VRKFLQFQLTVNVVAMFIVFFGAVFLKDAPLNAVQMLWVNLIMDTFAALALATEPPEHNVLTRAPYPKDSAIVTEVMWRNVFGHAIYQSIVLIVLIFATQGWLCLEYDYPCMEGMVEKRCDAAGYNAFFTKGLYYQVGD
jgi:Ca2+ transporting ATPase